MIRSYLNNKIYYTDLAEYPNNSLYCCSLSIGSYPFCIKLLQTSFGMRDNQLVVGNLYSHYTFRMWGSRTMIVLLKIAPDEYWVFQGESPTVDSIQTYGLVLPLKLYPIFFDKSKNDFYLLTCGTITKPWRAVADRPNELLETCSLSDTYKLVSHYNLMPIDRAYIYMPSAEVILTKVEENKREQLISCLSEPSKGDDNYIESLEGFKYND